MQKPGTSQWSQPTRNRLLFGPFSPYAARVKTKVTGGKKPAGRKDLFKTESEAVLTDRSDRKTLNSPYVSPSTTRSLPISPFLFSAKTPPVTTPRRSHHIQDSQQLSKVKAELQVYKEECKRLQSQLTEGTHPNPVIERLQEQIRSLQLENTELKAALQRLQSPLNLSIPKRAEHSPFSLLTETKPDLSCDTEQKWTVDGVVGTEEMIWTLTRHMSYRLQMNGIEKRKLPEIITGKLTKLDLSSLFHKSPFHFSSLESELLVKFLLQSHRSLPGKDVINRLYTVLPSSWPVFSASTALRHTQELRNLFSRNYNEIYSFCKGYDMRNTGWIRPEEFMEGLKHLGVELEEETGKYLELLCYSHRKELDRVPYKALLSTCSSTSLPSDSTQIHRILKKLARYLDATSLRPRDIFACEEGYISPEGLIKGLQEVPGMELSEEEGNALLAELQDEEMEEPCVRMRDMEEVMRKLGVEVEKAPGIETQMMLHRSQSSHAYLKQVSFLDATDSPDDGDCEPRLFSSAHDLDLKLA